MSEQVKRKYVMSDGNLRQLGVNFKGFATRDLALLNEYGITADTLTNLDALLGAFIALPIDAIKRTDIKYAAIAKNNKSAEIIDIVEKIQTRANMAFGIGSSEYEDFGFNNVNEADDNSLSTIVALVINAATRHQAALAARGQTVAEITGLAAKVDEYTELIKGVATAESDRRDATRDRILAGNALYDAIGDIAAAGKRVFSVANPALLSDYLLYPDAGTPQSPPPQVEGIGYASPNLYWNEAPRALYYNVEVSHDGGATYQPFADHVEDPQIEVDIPLQGTAKYRVIAVNAAGHGQPSAAFTFVGSVGSPAGISYDSNGFHVTPVTGAEEYQILYGPPGGSVDAPSTTEVSVSSSPDYGWIFPYTGTWVFYVRVKVGGVWGAYLVQEITFA